MESFELNLLIILTPYESCIGSQLSQRGPRTGLLLDLWSCGERVKRNGKGFVGFGEDPMGKRFKLKMTKF